MSQHCGSRMRVTTPRIGVAIVLVALLGWACSGGEESAAPTPPLAEEATSPLPSEVSAPAPLGSDDGSSEGPTGTDAEAEFNQPPAEIQQAGEMVRCLIDSPPGCDGCDQGDTCVYEQLSSYDCVYVVYGTACK